jgi:monoamine oxidase
MDRAQMLLESPGMGTTEDAALAHLPLIDELFPGAAEAYIAGSAQRMHWPTYELTKGSYTCWRVGQGVFYGSEEEAVDNVHFAGEHTSGDYQGWMEGGAESGVRAATEIIDALAARPAAVVHRLASARQVSLAKKQARSGFRAKRQSEIRARRLARGLTY